jgi:RNA polymerase sigma factor (sigma-70 family)
MGEAGAVLTGRLSADRASAAGQCDDELVAGVRAGDAAAFEQIYDRYARGILAFCVHMLGNREAAEDALQLTFVSAYRALRNGERSIALRPWLYTIARNRCLSELRARRDAVVDPLVTDPPAIEGLADQVQRREDLREMLEDMRRLPADQRAALVLFELGDQPQREIATVLGVRTEKVKALVFQAREALVRGRTARAHPCREIREQMATLEGRIPARSMLRAHIERCPGCQSFEDEVHLQRAALALILPVPLTVELKSWILGSAFHGTRAVAAGVGACGGGGGVVAAGACGGGAVGGGAVAGGAGVVGGLSGTGALTATAASGVIGTGAGAVASATPAVVAAAGLTAAGETVTGLGATGVVAKLLTAAAIATVAASSSHSDKPLARPGPPPDPARQSLLASAVTPSGARNVPTTTQPTAASTPPSVTATPLGDPGDAPSSTSAGSSGSTSASASSTPSGARATAPASTATSAGATPPPSAGTGGQTSATPPPPAPGSGSTAASPGSSGDADPISSSPASSPDPTASSADTSTSAGSAGAAPTAAAPTDTGGGSGSAPPPASPDAGGNPAPAASADTTSSSATSSGASAPASSPAMTPATPAVETTNTATAADGSLVAGNVGPGTAAATAGP